MIIRARPSVSRLPDAHGARPPTAMVPTATTRRWSARAWALPITTVLTVVVMAMQSAVAFAAIGDPVAASSCWRPPVRGVVSDPFRAPSCPWCAGNRGLEYRVGRDATVVAAAPGVVTFAAPVAGVRYVVVALDDGRRHTYGRLTEIRATVGRRVAAGAVLGAASGQFFFGLRDGDTYLDPAPYLGELITRRRLVPTDGTAPRPAPPPVLRCGGRDVRAGRRPDSIDPVESHDSAAVRSDVSLSRRSHMRSPRRNGRRPDGTEPHRGEHHGRHHHAANARSRRPLRSPDPAVEPEDEALHLR